MKPLGLVQRLLGAAIGIVLFVAALVFASLLLALGAVLAFAVWGWLWWRTRDIRRAARERGGVVIEGEYRVERDIRRLDDEGPPPGARN